MKPTSFTIGDDTKNENVTPVGTPASIKPMRGDNINFSLGCYGCRESTNIKDEENLIGIPFSRLNTIINNLEHLVEKPMKKASSKDAFNSFGDCGQ